MWEHRKRGVMCFCFNQMAISETEANEDPTLHIALINKMFPTGI